LKRDIRVAIVEDENDIREAMRVLINGSQGFECIHVYFNAEDALLELPKLDLDVIVMDINLPGIDGVTCVQRLKPQMHRTQFMMCTVFDNDEKIFEALQSGANGYILKRTSPAQILEAIRELHDGGSPMSSEIARRVVDSLQKKGKHSESSEILTIREKEILDYLAKGFLYKEIAQELNLSKETVKKHVQNIYSKLQVQNRTEAINKAFKK
jgi:DNA-binding NarL/FixJ family response regulator